MQNHIYSPDHFNVLLSEHKKTMDQVNSITPEQHQSTNEFLYTKFEGLIQAYESLYSIMNYYEAFQANFTSFPSMEVPCIQSLTSLEFDLIKVNSSDQDYQQVCNSVNGLLGILLKCVKMNPILKMAYPSQNFSGKLLNFMFIIMRVFISNNHISSNSITILNQILRQNDSKEDCSIVGEQIINLLREIVHDKHSSSTLATINDLIVKTLQSISTMGIPEYASDANQGDDMMEDCEGSSRSFNHVVANRNYKISFDKLIDNRIVLLTVLQSVIEFFDSKCRESKSREYKKIWKSFCTFVFSNYQNHRYPICTLISQELVTHIIKILNKVDVSTQEKTSLFDTLQTFCNKNFDLFYTLYGKSAQILSFSKDKVEFNLKKLVDKSQCYICSETRQKSYTKVQICEDCSSLLNYLNKKPQKLRQKACQEGQSNIFDYFSDFCKHYDIKALLLDLIQNAPSLILDKGKMLPYLIADEGLIESSKALFGKDPDFVNKFNSAMHESNFKNNNASITNSFTKALSLYLMSNFCQSISEIKNIVLIKMNVNSSALRLKSLTFFHSIIKSAPKLFTSSPEVRIVMEDRLYDSSQVVRQGVIETFETYYQSQIKDIDFYDVENRQQVLNKDGFFDHIMDRMNDISASIRSSVIKLLVRILLDLEGFDEDVQAPELAQLSQKIFQIVAMKVFDVEEVSSLAHASCLMILFKSFNPTEKNLKKITNKSQQDQVFLRRTSSNPQNAHFDRILNLLLSSFEVNGENWYSKLIDKSKEYGSFGDNGAEIQAFIKYITEKLHIEQQQMSAENNLSVPPSMYNDENSNCSLISTKSNSSSSSSSSRDRSNSNNSHNNSISMQYSDISSSYLIILKPFSKKFSSTLLNQLNYFYEMLKQFNQNNGNNQNIELANRQRPLIKNITEIIYNIVDNCEYKECLLNSSTFKKLQTDLLTITFRETFSILHYSIKTICLIIRKLTFDHEILRDLFKKCWNLVSVFIVNDSHKNPNYKYDPFSIMRAAYIVAYIVKYLGVEELCAQKQGQQTSSDYVDDIMNELYDNFLYMINSQDNVDIRRAGIECMACLWEKKPLLCLKCREIVDNFINSSDFALHQQILRVFHNIIYDYHQNHQQFYEKLKQNFKEKVSSASSSTQPSKKKKKQQTEKMIPDASTSTSNDDISTQPTTNSAYDDLKDITSVIQMISESASKVISNVYHYDQETKITVLRVVLLLIQEGHCHVHTIFKRVFALVSDTNRQVRALALEIIQEALQKNSSIISLELENGIIETKQVFNNNTGSHSLFTEPDENSQKPNAAIRSVYDSVYNGFYEAQKSKELKLRGLIDASCALLLTMGNNYEQMKFLGEFVCSLTKIEANDYIKWIAGLDSYITKRYQKVKMMMKPLVRAINSQSSQPSTSSSTMDKEQANEEQNNDSTSEECLNMIKDHSNQIFSLLIAEIFLFFTLKLTRDGETGKGLFLLDEEETLSDCVELVQRKLLNDEQQISKIRLNMEKEVIEAINITLQAYLDITTYSNAQNFKDLYYLLKSVYKINNNCFDMFEGVGPNSNISSQEKQDATTKNKKKKKKVTKKIPSSANKISRYNKTSVKKKVVVKSNNGGGGSKYAAKPKARVKKEISKDDGDVDFKQFAKSGKMANEGQDQGEQRWNTRLRKRKTVNSSSDRGTPLKQIQF